MRSVLLTDSPFHRWETEAQAHGARFLPLVLVEAGLRPSLILEPPHPCFADGGLSGA